MTQMEIVDNKLYTIHLALIPQTVQGFRGCGRLEAQGNSPPLCHSFFPTMEAQANHLSVGTLLLI